MFTCLFLAYPESISQHESVTTFATRVSFLILVLRKNLLIGSTDFLTCLRCVFRFSHPPVDDGLISDSYHLGYKF